MDGKLKEEKLCNGLFKVILTPGNRDESLLT